MVVVIKEGGRKLIQVTDDGIGMDEQDAVNSFLRHATSKISTLDDLEAITTFGFRGEALASVAAVAQVTMKTRRREDEAAVVLRIDGGGKPQISHEGREPGTSLVAQNLFFNVPARRKFLKSANTEFRHVYDTVQRVALSRPDVGLCFVSDDDTILDLRPASLRDRLLDIFGQRQVEGMVWVEEESEYLAVSGYIGKPAFGKRTRANQYLFLNRRPIVNRNINHAVFSSYEHLLIKGTYPFFLLFIEIDPQRIDVNVHPSKLEAKFDDEQNIYRFVSALVRKGLASDDLVPGATINDQRGEDESVGLRFTDRQHGWPGRAGFAETGGFSGRPLVDTKTGEILNSPIGNRSMLQSKLPFEAESPGPFPGGVDLAGRLLGNRVGQFIAAMPGKKVAQGDQLEPVNTSLIWQLHSKYILLQIENGVMIVDQHVAHERVLYERARARFDNNAPVSQQLLFPRTVQLTPGDHSLFTELLPHFQLLGFSVKPFGMNTIVVEGVPPDIKGSAEERIIGDLLSLYKEYQQSSPADVRDNLAKSYSCKAAIKAGDAMNEQEMRSLIAQLFETKMPYVCPHGRPIVLRISIDELDRRFGRT